MVSHYLTDVMICLNFSQLFIYFYIISTFFINFIKLLGLILKFLILSITYFEGMEETF